MHFRAQLSVALAALVASACALDHGGLGGPGPAGPEATGADASVPADASGPPGLDAADLDAAVTDTDAGNTDSGAKGDAAVPGEAGSPSDSGAGDAAAVEAGSCGTSCVVVPVGWALVAFEPSRSAACPAGFTNQPTDVVEGPAASASACSCGACSVTAQPTCDTGSVAVHYDATRGNPGTCALPTLPGTGPLANSPPGSCGTDLYQGSYATFDVKYTSPPPAGGACASPGVVASGGGVTYAAEGRTCAPEARQTAGCDGGACSPALPAPFVACITTAGRAACPPGPMSVQHVVGTSAAVSCSACVCAVTAACSGTVTLYTDSSCNKNPYPVPADGSCNPVYQQGASYNSYVYSGGAAQNVSCNASGTSTATVVLEGEVTVCCAP